LKKHGADKRRTAPAARLAQITPGIGRGHRTAGLAFCSLVLFYWIIDVLGFVRWSFFFRVIGMNSLVMYLAYRFIDFGETSRLLFSGIYGHLAADWHGVFNALGGLLVAWLFLYFLWRKQVFVKV